MIDDRVNRILNYAMRNKGCLNGNGRRKENSLRDGKHSIRDQVHFVCAEIARKSAFAPYQKVHGNAKTRAHKSMLCERDGERRCEEK